MRGSLVAVLAVLGLASAAYASEAPLKETGIIVAKHKKGHKGGKKKNKVRKHRRAHHQENAPAGEMTGGAAEGGATGN